MSSTNSRSTNWWGTLTQFQKFFFIFFIALIIISFFSPLALGKPIGELFTVMSIIGIICSSTGVLASIYQARGQAVLYFFLIINTVTYAVIAWNSDLYGQVVQNLVILLPIQIIGIFEWMKHTKSEDHHVEINTFKPSTWVWTIIGLLIAWGLYTLFLMAIPDLGKYLFNLTIAPDPNPISDSFVTAITITAMYLTAKRYFEQWYFWIIANFGVVLFIEGLVETKHYTTGILINDFSGAINWLQYGVGAIYGFYLWRKMHKEDSIKAHSNN